ncbi:hypothetical protein D3C81_09380 [compost metagenome]
MILHGQKKRVLKDVIKYYVATTQKEYDDFILSIQQNRGIEKDKMSYTDWLAVKCFGILQKHDIHLADCIENKDIIHSAIKEEKSRLEGEFYTPEPWCVEGRNYLKALLKEKWGNINIWDGSCGTSNLMFSENYPSDKLFLSTLLKEDIPMVEERMPNATIFDCDFLDGIDWDENNKFFSNKLPSKLLKALENNEPIVFFMNPPYKVMKADSTDVGQYMSDRGMTKCALDLFHQFMYRIVMLKRFYKLTEVYLGIYGPVTMFHSDMIAPLYNEFKKEFKFVDGMCFTAGDFSNTSESVEWVVGYTVWRTKIGEEEDKRIILDAKTLDSEGNVKIVGKRLITAVDINLHDWVVPKDVLYYEQAPVVTNYNNFTGQFLKWPVNALGEIMSSNYVIRATRRCAVTSLPNPDNVAITKENFWRCVASFGARRVYASKSNPYNNCQYYSMPDTSLAGFEDWVIDTIPLFLFDNAVMTAAYRGIVIEGTEWNVVNKLFPLSAEEVEELATDPVILEDIEGYGGENTYILEMIQGVQHRFSPEAKELFDFGINLLKESLTGNIRADLNYENGIQAWDSSIAQIRNCKNFFTKEKETKYMNLLSKLKEKLYDGVYKYGFMLDTAFTTSEESDEEDLIDGC